MPGSCSEIEVSTSNWNGVFHEYAYDQPVWSSIAEKFSKAVFGGKLLARTGTLQREGQVIHVIAKTLYDWSSEIYKLHEGVQNFALHLGRGDERATRSGDNRHRPRDAAAMMKLGSQNFR